MQKIHFPGGWRCGIDTLMQAPAIATAQSARALLVWQDAAVSPVDSRISEANQWLETADLDQIEIRVERVIPAAGAMQDGESQEYYHSLLNSLYSLQSDKTGELPDSQVFRPSGFGYATDFRPDPWDTAAALSTLITETSGPRDDMNLQLSTQEIRKYLCRSPGTGHGSFDRGD